MTDREARRARRSQRYRGLARLWARAFRSSFANQAAYRGDFIMNLVVSLLFEMLTPLATVLAYGATDGAGFPGWTMEEALLIQAVFLVSRGIAFPLFFGIVWVVFNQVREGTFELTLLRPRSPLLVAVTAGVDVSGFGQLAGGLLLLGWTVNRLGAVTPERVLLFLPLLGLSVLTLLGCALFMSGTLFVWIGNSRVLELLDSILIFGRYPGSIFTSGFQFFLAALIPVSMIALFPAEALLGRTNGLLLAGIPASLVFFGLGVVFWNHMCGKYAGGGG